MWRTVCGYGKKEQTIIALLQSLNENKKAEKAVSKSTVPDLNVDNDDGLEKLFEKLDSTFKMEKNMKNHIMFIKISINSSNWKTRVLTNIY